MYNQRNNNQCNFKNIKIDTEQSYLCMFDESEISFAEFENDLEKKELLTKAGYSENATDPIYTCPKCKDTGVLEDGSTCSCYGEILEKINGK